MNFLSPTTDRSPSCSVPSTLQHSVNITLPVTFLKIASSHNLCVISFQASVAGSALCDVLACEVFCDLKTAFVNYYHQPLFYVSNFSNINGKFVDWWSLISVRFSDDDALVSSYQLVARDSSRGKRSIKCCYFCLVIISTYACCLVQKKLGFWVKLCLFGAVLSYHHFVSYVFACLSSAWLALVEGYHNF